MKNTKWIFTLMAPGRLAASLAVSGAVLVFSAQAFASPSYPGALQEAAGLPCEPSCVICHDSATGAQGTANQPFALALGVFPASPETIGPAFDALYADEDMDGTPDQDSDGDGEPDVFELTKDVPSDPNSTSETLLCQAEIKYGCSAARTEPAPSRWFGPWLLAGLGVLVFARRRRASARY